MTVMDIAETVKLFIDELALHDEGTAKHESYLDTLRHCQKILDRTTPRNFPEHRQKAITKSLITKALPIQIS